MTLLGSGHPLDGQWRHLKSGGVYEVVTLGLIEATEERAVVYAGVEGGGTWIRPYDEFVDGRFVRVIRLSDLTPPMRALFAKDLAIVWDAVRGGYLDDLGGVVTDREWARQVRIGDLYTIGVNFVAEGEHNFHLERP
jgi:hypothetical protein